MWHNHAGSLWKGNEGKQHGKALGANAYKGGGLNDRIAFLKGSFLVLLHNTPQNVSLIIKALY